MEGTKQRHPSGGASSYTDPTLGMEGVELVAEGEVRDEICLVLSECGMKKIFTPNYCNPKIRARSLHEAIRLVCSMAKDLLLILHVDDL